MDNGELFAIISLDNLMPTLSADNKDTLELQNMMILPLCEHLSLQKIFSRML